MKTQKMNRIPQAEKLTQILEQIKNGKNISLYLDNDDCTFHDDDNDAEIICIIHNQELLEEALTALKINWKWC